MKKLILGLSMLAGVVATAPVTANAQIIVPVRPCYYTYVPVTQYVLTWTIYGYVYQPVTTYVYQLVCY